MKHEELHLDRARAESFGSVAEQYDRYRPGYPDALIDDLASLAPTRVLDVGCGTGKAAVALVDRGLSVLGVEVDERMADVARGHGLDVEVAAFETWDDAGRRFDLVTCGEAWHWIDPGPGLAKLATVLRGGGIAAWFWTASQFDEPVVRAFDTVYQQYAPEIAQVWRPSPAGPPRQPSAGSDAFISLGGKTYQWEETLTADEWIGLAATVSDHLRLGPARLAALLPALRAAIDSLGGQIRSSNTTTAVRAQRLPGRAVPAR